MFVRYLGNFGQYRMGGGYITSRLILNEKIVTVGHFRLGSGLSESIMGMKAQDKGLNSPKLAKVLANCPA